MADRPLTGVLLVGGASSRFGAPKALAELDGKTLAQRGWETLEAACDEVLAVGKLADDLGLPFPLVDDATSSRAPVFGVLAALRAARHDVCVVLPVDCPLVTPALVSALGRAGAVTQTGPLPGAYARSLQGVLEERVARGELSLRGVNPVVLEVDERLLVDVDTPEDLASLSGAGPA